MLQNVLFGLALMQVPAQTATKTLPHDLPSLATMLPELVHANKMDFGPFSDAVTHAMQQQPDSISSAMPIFDRDLKDPDQQVQFYTLSILYALTLRIDGVQLLTPLYNEIIHSISTGNQYTKGLAMVTVGSLGPKVPDSFVAPIQHVLTDPGSTDRLVAGSAEALMLIRPQDVSTQTTIVGMIHDKTRSVQLRSSLLTASANPSSGSILVDTLVQIGNAPVTSADDRLLRDSALIASERIGQPALVHLQDRLNAMIADSSESPASQQLARQLLRQTQ